MGEGSSAAIGRLVASVEEARLRRWVEVFAGLRHGQENPGALLRAAGRFEEALAAAGLATERRPFRHRGREHHNVVAALPGREGGLAPWLLGAHFDAHAGSPGADDNASALAALLETARLLAAFGPRRGIHFVGFDLEERQGRADWRCKHGSRHFARRARWAGARYEGVLILESVGYADERPGSQRLPVRLPGQSRGNFLGVVGTRRSRKVMARVTETAAAHVPGFPVVARAFPLNGLLLPMTRASDHAPFWDWGYPAVMLTDTAFLRNPNYHRPTDLPGTLDYSFLANVTRVAVATLAGG